MAAPLEGGGWRVAVGYAGSAGAASGIFHGVYAETAGEHSGRGMIAILARGHGPDGGPAAGGLASAQLVAAGLADGYFGGRRTLSAQRAAGLAFDSLNGWLFRQSRGAGFPPLTPVSVTALMFHGRLGVAQIGMGCALRVRDGVAAPLAGGHARVLADGSAVPTRAVGLGDEIAVDYAEDMAMAGDCYVLLGGLELAGHDALLAGLGAATEGEDAAVAVLAALAALPGGDKAALVLRVLAAPAVDAAVTRAGLAALPLRPTPREGDVWDGFRIGRTLHAGRYTMVVAARDTVEGRDVALKIPRPAMLQDEVFTAGFLREAWIGATVRGAGVARYIELPPERRRSLYLAMPLYRGETLEARLQRAPPVGLPDGIGIALKLCAAVQDLAAIQVVHRDLKPDNVMLLERGEVRLLDLGLAYLPGIDIQDAVLPGGTLRYMAPELMRGVPANPRSEVFALAVTIYRMFAAGAFPFGQREAVPLARLRPDLPGWLGRILQRALAPDPAARFADAGGLAAALRDGLIAGRADVPAAAPLLTRLLVWQALAALFAFGFLVLLIRALR